ncbi:MAG: TadE/TadG family type IV pilus assembly protein [Rhizobiaceae bacterium]
MSVGILALPLIMSAGVAVDYTMVYNKRSSLQQAIDAAALATSKEQAGSNLSDADVDEVAETYVYSNLGITAASEIAKNLTIETKISDDQTQVTINASLIWSPMLIQHLTNNVLPLKVTTTAARAGEENVCVIALNNTKSDTLSVTRASSITANNCAIYSNSAHSRSISTDMKSQINGSSVYSSGGYSGPEASYKTKPVVDAPAIPDPLIDRAEPVSGTCVKKNYFVTSGNITLQPGTYCGGIDIGGKANVTFMSGIYIIKDGPFYLCSNATMTGQNVGFFFEGNKSFFEFCASTQVNLSAPKTGPMAGILFFEQRSATTGRLFAISSKDAEKFEGTVYLPKGKLLVEKGSRLGQASNWTAIIANEVVVDSGPMLEINSNYGASDIPVPEGIEGKDGQIRLVK